MKLHSIYLVAAASAVVALAGCKKDDPSAHNFTNQVFVEQTAKPQVMFIKKGGVVEQTKTIRAAIADPATQEVQLTFAVQPEMVDTYNAAFYDKAILLPAENYELPKLTAVILRGSVYSSEVAVHFKQIDQLDPETVYVLPLTLVESTVIPILERSKTSYFVFRGAALINIVGNVANNYLDVNWARPQVMNNLSQMSMEALVRVKKFDRKISTIMGIEGHFLLRIGDSSLAPNQVQLATSSDNLPSKADSKVAIPTDEWTHIAVTYDNDAGSKAKIYINGELKIEGTVFRDKVNWGVYTPVATEDDTNRGFHIGYSFENARYLDGDLSEVRIWNRVLTAEELAERDHFYYVDPASEGLIAYWKFDDAEGAQVKDHTLNANHAVGIKTLIWNATELPVQGK